MGESNGKGVDQVMNALLGALGKRLARKLRGQIPRVLRGVVDEEDISQLAMVEVWKRYEKERTAAECWALMEKVGRQKLIDEVRRARRKRHGGGVERVEMGEAAGVSAGREGRPDVGAMESEALAEVMGRLKGRNREILLLLAAGYGAGEMAAALGVSERTIQRGEEAISHILRLIRA